MSRRPLADGTAFGAVFELALASLPEALASPEEHAGLRRLAARLTPVPRGGFECRLGERAPTSVDLQQGISARDREPLIAADHIRQAAIAGWEVTQDLMSSWAVGELDGVAEVWLELDAGVDAPPSLFVRIDNRARGRTAAAVVDAIVPAGDAPSVHAVLDRCVRELVEPAVVSHVGVMFGRAAVGVRLHVSGLRLGAVEGYLGHIGWAGDREALLRHARRLLDVGDGLAICLDVLAGRLLPRAGLECFFTRKSGLDMRWKVLLDSLCEDGLCTRTQARALIAWPGQILPRDVDDWPDELIVREIGREADELGVVERRLSHVKVTLAPREPPSAKAYFGFGAVFVRVGDRRAVRAAPATAPAPDASSALKSGIDFLLVRRTQAGWWRDFVDRARPPTADKRDGIASDEWVSAYVGCALAGFDEPRARAAAGEALSLLMARRGRDGWGFHALAPHDADSTTWVLRLRRRLGAPAERRDRQAAEFLRSTTAPDGGVATYRAADTPLLEQFVGLAGSYDGWCGVHLCVTAAAAVLGLDDGTRAYLRAAQGADGSWSGYWWDDDEYTTARATEALAGEAAAQRAASWAASRVGEGPAFPTALALLALAAAPDPRHASAADQAISRLLESQRADGSWAPSARLRIPLPDALDARAEGTLHFIDDGALFTTATVLEALRRSAPLATPSPRGARA